MIFGSIYGGIIGLCIGAILKAITLLADYIILTEKQREINQQLQDKSPVGGQYSPLLKFVVVFGIIGAIFGLFSRKKIYNKNFYYFSDGWLWFLRPLFAPKFLLKAAMHKKAKYTECLFERCVPIRKNPDGDLQRVRTGEFGSTTECKKWEGTLKDVSNCDECMKKKNALFELSGCDCIIPRGPDGQPCTSEPVTDANNISAANYIFDDSPSAAAARAAVIAEARGRASEEVYKGPTKAAWDEAYEKAKVLEMQSHLEADKYYSLENQDKLAVMKKAAADAKFHFQKVAKANTNVITDEWGKQHDYKNIKVLKAQRAYNKAQMAYDDYRVLKAHRAYDKARAARIETENKLTDLNEKVLEMQSLPDAPPPHGWTAHYDPKSGKTYYNNAGTGVSSWERPSEMSASELSVARTHLQEDVSELQSQPTALTPLTFADDLAMAANRQRPIRW